MWLGAKEMKPQLVCNASKLMDGDIPDWGGIYSLSVPK